MAVDSALPEVPIDLPALDCPEGTVLTHLIVEWVTPSETQTVYEYTAPEWISTMPVEFPGCLDGSCTVSLWRVFSDAPAAFCGQAAVGCPEWWQDGAKADHYECRYGTYPIDLGYCAIFRKPGTISPNTATQTTPDGSLVRVGDPIVSTDPDAFTDLDTNVDPVPEPGTPGDPEPVPQSGQCFPQGWGVFNPPEWVYRPITCALTWAFIPRAGVVQADLQDTSDALSANGLLAVIPAAAAVPGIVAEGASGGCSGGLVTMEADTAYGPIGYTFPCSPGEGSAPLGVAYATWYDALSVLVVASGGWSGFMIVRANLGTRSE